MKKILSPNNQYIRDLFKLHEKKHREVRQEFLVEGYHLISEARGFLKQVLITDEKDFQEGVENILVSKDIIKKLAFTITPQPIIGVCRFFPEYEISGKRILLLDNLQDPGNLGTLIRTSLGFGVDLIILGNNSVDLYNDKFLRASQGAVFRTQVIKGDISEVLNVLRETGVVIIGTCLKGKPLREVLPHEKYALILGNEGSGVNEEILKQTDFNVFVEMSPKLESLNVAIAGAIIMHHLDKK